MCFIGTLVIHVACTVSEILAKSPRYKFDLSDFENDPLSDSAPIIVWDRIVLTQKRIHDVIYMFSTLLLLNNIDNYGEMGQTWPFFLENNSIQIHLLTVDQYNSQDAICKK